MKKSGKQVQGQTNLLLLSGAATTSLPVDKQKQLARALMELLLNAAEEELTPSKGGEHD